MMLPVRDPLAVTGRPTRAEIDLEAFDHNLRLALRLGGGGRELMAVLKADAYGHGAVPLARRAARAGASSIGVATVTEARCLRRAGVRLPVHLLNEPAPAAAAEVVALECVPVLYSLQLAEALEDQAREAGRRIPVHIKIDTGMGRVGIGPSEALQLAARIAQMPHLRIEGLLSHLSEADRLDTSFTFRQLKEFARLCRKFKEQHPALRFFHIANSALLMRGDVIGNLTRPGIMLYGAPPTSGFPDAGLLSPVMRFVTAVSFLKRVPAGTPLSYGGTYRTRRESLIATLPVGYADGYPRGISNRADVLIRGKRARQVGTICMDLCLVDVTDVPGVTTGDEVVLIGSQGGGEIPADELAALLGTISYEIFCGVSHRVPRLHHCGTPDPGGPE
jgi:alanine racemase